MTLAILSSPKWVMTSRCLITHTHFKRTPPMDLLQACDELKSVIHTAELLVSAWEDDEDNYAAIKEHLTDLATELRRIERGDS